MVAALASRAELLLLDAPTAGLDPLMEATFRECVNDERREGRTILLAGHLLAEAVLAIYPRLDMALLAGACRVLRCSPVARCQPTRWMRRATPAAH